MLHGSVKLRWATPNAEEELAYITRVSNPKAKLGDPAKKLIEYVFKNKHWSPFEMVNLCLDISTTRDISRQLLRHRSFSFQEFSGRYAAYDNFAEPRECRLQDAKNRQNSLPNYDGDLHIWWFLAQKKIRDLAVDHYKEALKHGIAKEVARAILPEGLTTTRVFVNGNLRSWIHYCQVRCTPETQKEHRELAEACRAIIVEQFPTIKDLM